MNILKIPREAAFPWKVLAKMNLTLDYSMIKATIDTVFTVPSAILDMQPRTRENEAGVDSC